MEEPGSSFGFFGADVSIWIGFGEELLLAVVVESVERDAFVAASEGIGGVDVVVAGDAESSGVCFACDVSRSLFTDFAECDAVMAGGEFVGGVDVGVTGDTEES